MKQSGTDGLTRVRGHNSASAVCVVQKVMAAFDAKKTKKPAFTEGGHEVGACDAGETGSCRDGNALDANEFQIMFRRALDFQTQFYGLANALALPRRGTALAYPGNGDRHVLVLDRDNCWLYELYSSLTCRPNRQLESRLLARCRISRNDEQAPLYLDLRRCRGPSNFSGLARYDEVASRRDQSRAPLHPAIQSDRLYSARLATQPGTPPTLTPRPWACACVSIRPSISRRFPPQSKVILAALQKYGMILADNGSSIYISGDPDNRWNNNDLGSLKSVPASAFEVVQINPLYTPANVPTGPAPVIATFTANPTTVTKGQPVTLSWNVTGASYNVVSPQVGAIRGASVVVTPTATTTYTLTSTNAYGRTTAKVKVTLQ